MSKVFRILVIDDDLITREIIAFTLTNEGYKVQLANNGQEGLNLAKEDVFDLIISDLHMPVMNGLDFCSELKSLQEYKLTPFLFVSSDKKRNYRIKGLAEGADDFILKPLDPKLLLAKVKACLKKYIFQKDLLLTDRSNHLNFKSGSLVICASKSSSLAERIKKSISSALLVTDLTAFTNCLDSNVWIVVIMDDAKWGLDAISKISELTDEKDAQICLLTTVENEEGLLKLIAQYPVEVIPKYNSIPLVIDQIKLRINREFNLKNKYVGALNRAANSSPLRFEKEQIVKNGNLKFYIFHHPYEQMPGGDYYEVFDLPDGSNLIAIGDVMGKEWGAWFFVMGYIAYLRSSIKFLLNTNPILIESPHHFLNFLNDHIYRDIQLSEVFTTLTLVHVCNNKNTIKLASAGGLPPLVYDSDKDIVREIELKGSILGLESNVCFGYEELELIKGDSLVIYTDGYIEAFSGNNTMVGRDNMISFIKSYNKKAGKQFPIDFERTFQSSLDVITYRDDRTVLIMLNEG